jgi:hypothetical protein
LTIRGLSGIGVYGHRTINLTSSGTLFSVTGSSAKVTFEDITLNGLATNNNALVVFSSGATLTVKENVKIINNTNSTATNNAAGVKVDGTLHLYGEISGHTLIGNFGNGVNTSAGVYLTTGTFYMYPGAKINNNTNNNVNTGDGVHSGGIYVNNGSQITGGEIKGNVKNSGGGSSVGGMALYGGGLSTISNLEITGNISSMTQGEIKAAGVLVCDNGTDITVNMTNVTISGNIIRGNSSTDIASGIYIAVTYQETFLPKASSTVNLDNTNVINNTGGVDINTMLFSRGRVTFNNWTAYDRDHTYSSTVSSLSLKGTSNVGVIHLLSFPGRDMIVKTWTPNFAFHFPGHKTYFGVFEGWTGNVTRINLSRRENNGFSVSGNGSYNATYNGGTSSYYDNPWINPATVLWNNPVVGGTLTDADIARLPLGYFEDNTLISNTYRLDTAGNLVNK